MKSIYFSRRRLLGAAGALAGLACTSALLQACGQAATPEAPQPAGQPTQAQPKKAEATPTTATEAKSSAPTATVAAAEKPAPPAQEATIVFYVWGGDPEKEVWTNVVESFQKANPGVKTDLQVLGSAFAQKLTASFAAGAPPDSFYSGGGVPFGSAKVAQLLPIDEYVKRDNVDLAGYFPVTLDVYRYKGKLYSLPIECGGHVIYFNKDLFEQAGQTTPDQLAAEGKWNWDQLITTAKGLTKSPDQFGYAVWRWTQMAVYAWSLGGSFVDNERDPTKSLWDQPIATEALQYWVDLRATHEVAPTQGFEQAYGGVGAVAVQMASNKLGMAVQGAWERLFLKDVTFKYDIVMMPTGNQPVTEGYSSAAVGTAASKNKDATWQWIKFTGGEEGQKIYAGLISVPPLRQVAESDWFLSKPPVNNKVYLEALTVAKPPISFPDIQKYNDVVNPVLDLVDAGKLTPGEATQQIHKQLQEEVFTGA